MIRVSSFALAGAALVGLFGAGLFVAPAHAADDPRDVAFGSFEILESEIRRVETLLGETFDHTYPRFDAPEGMTFLVLRWTLKPTFQPAEPYPIASIPHKQVCVETEAGKTAAIGNCRFDGTFREGWASLLAVDHENYADVYPFSAVFLVPKTAKRAKFLVAKLNVEEPLEGEILPRFDWRDGLDIEILKAEVLDEATRQESGFDPVSDLVYPLDYEFQPRSKGMLAVTLRLTAKRTDATLNQAAVSVTASDLRVARGEAPALMPIGRRYGAGIARLDQPALFADLSEDGKPLPIETTLVYPLPEPIETATLLYRNAPVGELEFELNSPAAPE